MDIKKAILRTVIYSNIFHYPLTFEQLYTFLLSKKRYTKADVKKYLLEVKSIVFTNGFIVLKGKESLIKQREQKKKWSARKKEKAKQISTFLSLIPTVLFIGVSGGVAIENADRNDDIDLFIIAKRKTLWITRLIIVSLLYLLGQYRSRTTQKVSDKICVNMLIDESTLAFTKNRKDIYTAHEIIQVLPLRERMNIYSRFLNKNGWVVNYMSHSLDEKKKVSSCISIPLISNSIEWILCLPFIEHIAKKVQMMKIKKTVTTETISSTILAFHPYDYREKTLLLYEKDIKKYEKIY